MLALCGGAEQLTRREGELSQNELMQKSDREHSICCRSTIYTNSRFTYFSTFIPLLSSPLTSLSSILSLALFPRHQTINNRSSSRLILNFDHSLRQPLRASKRNRCTTTDPSIPFPPLLPRTPSNQSRFLHVPVLLHPYGFTGIWIHVNDRL